MLERLRMQEVDEIILSVPEGVVIKNSNYTAGDPILVIHRPNLSNLDFRTIQKQSQDRGFIGASEQTNRLNFTINEGSISYIVWSYLHGVVSENTNSILKGTEYKTPQEGKIKLSATTQVSNLIVYKQNGTNKMIKLLPETDYTAYYKLEDLVVNTYIDIIDPEADKYSYFICYNYILENALVTTIKQINNNIFCTLDVYFDALDLETDEHKKVCMHCDKVQIFSDLAININSSTKTSFNPIQICSIAEKDSVGSLNKDVATFTVI